MVDRAVTLGTTYISDSAQAAVHGVSNELSKVGHAAVDGITKGVHDLATGVINYDYKAAGAKVNTGIDLKIRSVAAVIEKREIVIDPKLMQVLGALPNSAALYQDFLNARADFVNTVTEFPRIHKPLKGLLDSIEAFRKYTIGANEESKRMAHILRSIAAHDSQPNIYAEEFSKRADAIQLIEAESSNLMAVLHTEVFVNIQADLNAEVKDLINLEKALRSKSDALDDQARKELKKAAKSLKKSAVPITIDSEVQTQLAVILENHRQLAEFWAVFKQNTYLKWIKWYSTFALAQKKFFERSLGIVNGEEWMRVVNTLPPTPPPIQLDYKSLLGTKKVNFHAKDAASVGVVTDIPKTAEVSLSTIVRQGKLVKQGGQHKSWNDRWVVLTPVSLKYFSGRTNAEQDSKNSLGELVMTDCFKVEPCEDQLDGRTTRLAYCFYVTHKKRNYYFSAGSEQDKQEWITTLREYIKPPPGVAVPNHPHNQGAAALPPGSAVPVQRKVGFFRKGGKVFAPNVKVGSSPVPPSTPPPHTSAPSLGGGPPPPTDLPPPLPEGETDWEEVTSPEGQVYYYNHATGESSWDPPS